MRPAPAAPAAVVLSDNVILTTNVGGSFIARLQASDPNPSDSHAFQLVSGAGDTNNVLFQIIGNQLLATGNFGASAGQDMRLRVLVTDDSGRTAVQQIILPVQVPAKSIFINEIHYGRLFGNLGGSRHHAWCVWCYRIGTVDRRFGQRWRSPWSCAIMPTG